MAGRSGPHVISGVGFLAQQKYYNIFSVDSGPFIFRPPLKGLPEQPYPPNAFQSWTYSYNLNLIGQDSFPTGEQFWERPQLPIPPLAPTWIQTQFPVLVMQPPGQPVVGFAWFDLPPGQVPYRIDQTWTYSYNLNLIGQDRLPVGAAVFELPPRDYQRLQDLRTWLQATTALTFPPPRVQSDWPLPQTPARLDQFWSETFQQTLPADTTHILRPIWRSLPDQPPLPLQQQSAFPNYLLLQPPAVTYIIKQSDWPVPTAAPRLEQTWTWQYNLNLIGKDQLPIGEQISDLPPRDYLRAQDLRTWIQSVNLALVTAPPNLYAQARQQDWPIPRGAEPDWRRSWEFSFNKNLIGQDALPFRQSDWPLTTAAARAAELATWVDHVKWWLLTPFNQTDWPNPTQLFRDPTLATVARGYNLDLIGQDRLPNRQQDWPLSAAFTPTLLQTWIEATNFALLTPAAPLLPPLFMRNQDWPNPRGPIYPSDLRAWPIQGSPAPIIPGVPPPPPVGPAVYNKPMLAGPGYLNVIPGEKPS
jgi:hypothetical protein